MVRERFGGLFFVQKGIYEGRNLFQDKGGRKREVFMRKKGWLIAAGMVCVLVGGIILRSPLHADTGIYIDAGESFVVFEGGSGEPVVMRSGQGNDKMFRKLQTGDRILVFHDGTMMLSYPAQMNILFCIRLKKGDVSALPEGVMESLEEMGWIQGGAFGQDQ